MNEHSELKKMIKDLTKQKKIKKMRKGISC